MISRNYCRFDIRLFKECREHTDKYRVEKIFRLLEKSIIADSIYPENINEHDNYFEPKNAEERNFWVSCRELAKEDMFKLLKSIDSGKKSAEIRKQKKETRAPIVQQVPQPKGEKPEPELSPIKIKITEEEFLNWARQMDDMAGVGGFKNTETQAAMFWNHFNSQGWRKKNGMPITDPKSAYKLWVIKDKKDEVEEEQIQKVEIEVD